MDIAAWLRSIGLEHLEQVFRDNAIDAEVLPELTDEHLKENGRPTWSSAQAAQGHCCHERRYRGRSTPAAATPLVPVSPVEGERRQVAVLFADGTGL